jgi:hypothetical protein
MTQEQAVARQAKRSVAKNSAGGAKKAKKPASPAPKRAPTRKVASPAEPSPEKSKKGAGGRPPKYDAKVTAEQAYKLCLLGATDDDMADFFEVDQRTINRWKNDHPEFCQALKDGKRAADAKVASALFHRAIGYSHPEDKIFNDQGAAMVVPTTKHYPPDTTAGIFWLKNRDKERWRDSKDIEHGTKEGDPIRDLIETISGKVGSLRPGESD